MEPMEDTLRKLSTFVRPGRSFDIKSHACNHVLGLTGSPKGISMVLSSCELITSVVRLTTDPTKSIAKDAIQSLVNLSADEKGAKKVYKTGKGLKITEKAFQNILKDNSELADLWTMLLSNLTRSEEVAEKILDELLIQEKTLRDLMKAFSKLDYNKKGVKLDYLAQVFCNLTQCSRGREFFCKSQYNLLEKVIPFASYEGSLIRRRGVIGLIRNICFDPAYHDFILGNNDQILHCLLYPLAGPEEFTDEENDKLLITLQYLGAEKVREKDPELRKMLLESLLQLCAKKKYREVLRSKGVYEILREYHKWETQFGQDISAILACENVVDILIKKEDEIGVDNIKEVDVPSDIENMFIEDDKKLLLEN